MGELPPVAPEFPKKPYNRFLGNPPAGRTAAELYAEEMGIVEEIEPVLIHETVHGHEPPKAHKV